MSHYKHFTTKEREKILFFLAQEKNKYDSILLLSLFPINISFILDISTKIPFLMNWFKRIKTLFIKSNYDFIENVDVIENLNELISTDVKFDIGYDGFIQLLALKMISEKFVNNNFELVKQKASYCKNMDEMVSIYINTLL